MTKFRCAIPIVALHCGSVEFASDSLRFEVPSWAWMAWPDGQAIPLCPFV